MNMNAIEAKTLTKYYGDFLAVDNITFDVKTKEIFGFLGPNGAGKTTTIRMLTGILEPEEGEVKILGYDMKREKIKARENMGIVPEMANPYIDMTAIQNLELVGRLYGMKKREIKEKSEELLKIFDLHEKSKKKVRGYSKGMKQRLSLSMAMLSDPEIMFLDEPTSGLDVMSARLIKRIIREENKKGKTIFMSTHNMQDANELCTRVAIIKHGKIIAIDTPESIKKIGEEHSVVELSFEPFKFDRSIFPDNRIELLGDKVKIYTDDADVTVKRIVKYAENENLKIIALNVEKPSLEDVFMYLVGEKNE